MEGLMTLGRRQQILDALDRADTFERRAREAFPLDIYLRGLAARRWRDRAARARVRYARRPATDWWGRPLPKREE